MSASASVSPEPLYESDPDERMDRRAAQRAARSLAATVAKLHGALPLPVAAQRLLGATQTSEYKVSEVVRIIESDPALAARIMRQATSALLGRVRCTSIAQAVTRLGARMLQATAIAASAIDMFGQDEPTAQMVVKHANTTAASARFLARHCGLIPEEMYTCGLLHDIGKLMLLRGADLDYHELLDMEAGADQVHVAERERYGFDHALLAGHVLTSWKLPHPLPRVVAWHHQPARAYRAKGQIARMVALVRAADQLAHAQHVSTGEPIDSVLPQLAAELDILGVSEEAFRALCPDLLAEIDPEAAKDGEKSQSRLREAPPSQAPQADPAPRSRPGRRKPPRMPIDRSRGTGKHSASAASQVASSPEPAAEPHQHTRARDYESETEGLPSAGNRADAEGSWLGPAEDGAEAGRSTEAEGAWSGLAEDHADTEGVRSGPAEDGAEAEGVVEDRAQAEGAVDDTAEAEGVVDETEGVVDDTAEAEGVVDDTAEAEGAWSGPGDDRAESEYAADDSAEAEGEWGIENGQGGAESIAPGAADLLRSGGDVEPGPEPDRGSESEAQALSGAADDAALAEPTEPLPEPDDEEAQEIEKAFSLGIIARAQPAQAAPSSAEHAPHEAGSTAEGAPQATSPAGPGEPHSTASPAGVTPALVDRDPEAIDAWFAAEQTPAKPPPTSARASHPNHQWSAFYAYAMAGLVFFLGSATGRIAALWSQSIPKFLACALAIAIIPPLAYVLLTKIRRRQLQR